MGEVNITRRGVPDPLNFEVFIGNLAPSNPKENTIWVSTFIENCEWKIGNTNPYTYVLDRDIPFKSINAGYYSSSGVFTDQDATKLEMTWEGNPVQTETSTGTIYQRFEDNEVEYGKKYRYIYTMQESQSMWLAICEYNTDGDFVQRIVVVNSITGTSQVGYYTPSAENIAYVNISWRSFGDGNVMWSEVDSVQTVDDVTDGRIWIKNSPYGTVSIDAMKKGGLCLNIGGGETLIGSIWYPNVTSVYQNGEWVQAQLTKYLLNAPNQCEDITGGWTSTSGTRTLYADSIHIKGSTGRLSTTYMIDTRGFKTVEFDVMCTSTSAATQVGIGTTQSARVAYETLPLSMTDYQTISVDISDYQGMYYVNMQTAATNVGCYVKAVRLVG